MSLNFKYKWRELNFSLGEKKQVEFFLICEGLVNMFLHGPDYQRECP